MVLGILVLRLRTRMSVCVVSGGPVILSELQLRTAGLFTYCCVLIREGPDNKLATRDLIGCILLVIYIYICVYLHTCICINVYIYIRTHMPDDLPMSF